MLVLDTDGISNNDVLTNKNMLFIFTSNYSCATNINSASLCVALYRRIKTLNWKHFIWSTISKKVSTIKLYPKSF